MPADTSPRSHRTAAKVRGNRVRGDQVHGDRLRGDRARGDRGSSPVEFAIVATAMILLIFAVVQVGLVYHARSLALAAATQAANAGRGYQAPTGSASDVAAGFLADAGDGLTETSVTTVQTGTDVSVTVTGTAISVLPGITFTVSQTAHGSVEQPT